MNESWDPTAQLGHVSCAEYDSSASRSVTDHRCVFRFRSTAHTTSHTHLGPVHHVNIVQVSYHNTPNNLYPFEDVCYVTLSESHTICPGIATSSINSAQHRSDNHHTRKFVVQTVSILHTMPNLIHRPHHNTILRVRGHNGR